MSQYAQDSETEDSDEDVDTSVYDLEAGQFIAARTTEEI